MSSITLFLKYWYVTALSEKGNYFAFSTNSLCFDYKNKQHPKNETYRRNRNVFGKQPRAAMLVLIVEVGSSLFCIKANIGESNDKLVILFTQYHRIPMQPPNIFRIKPLDGENCL